MSYYLINEEDQLTICFVKDEDCDHFRRQCQEKILLHACNLMALVNMIHEEPASIFTLSLN
ncbi:hypothetical protein V9K67_16300 [Paraflavisolibacter sp. H34]|uniref:hypothetical protein n=1 Tax=Huijunlia imazamoxiresistens TaxID=3127457 RepID=UPI00301B17D5